jgi:acetyltransferase-like isoleucine patch superfamily enzyme
MLLEGVLVARNLIIQLPQYVFYWLFWWVYPTTVLRYKAAMCPYTHVRRLILIRSGVHVGKCVEIGFGMLCLGRGKNPPALDLADRVAIGPNVMFVSCTIPGCSRLSESAEVQKMIVGLGPIRVEEDAWLGAGVIVLPNITIGRGAIVGAGAVVTRGVAPYTVVAGVPARVIRTLSVAGSTHVED